MFRRQLPWMTFCLMSIVGGTPASAWNKHFHTPPPTLRQQAADNDFAVLVEVVNSNKEPAPGASELRIKKTIKAHPGLTGITVLKHDGYIPIPDAKTPPTFLVLGYLDKGKPVLDRGIRATPAVLDYLKGMLAFDAADGVKRLHYCFAFLADKDSAVSLDALREFAVAADADLDKAARQLAPGRVRFLLKQPQTAPESIDLYAFLLAHCGAPEDTALMQTQLDESLKAETLHGSPRLLIAYTMLDRSAGWARVCGLLKDPTQKFTVRYAALQAVRHFHGKAPDVIAEKDTLAALKLALQHDDLADFPVEYLRAWKCWKLTDEILALAKKEGVKHIVLRRVLEYALRCPEPAAVRYVTAMRKQDPERVVDAEEFLKLEETWGF